MTPAEAQFYARFMRRFCTSAALERLIVEHAVDVSGRCSTCRADGCNSGRVVGPCALLRLALAARAM